MPVARTVNGSIAYSLKQKTAGGRIGSIDLLRGTVMIIMALDHTRDYFHRDAFLFSPTDLTQTNFILFFTRWITHFCAPVFVFLAGVSAYLSGAKKGKKELSIHLLTRGFVLVLMELLIIGLLRTFDPTYTYIHLQVIWAIGLCMIALSALIFLNQRLILMIGLLIIAGHNLLDRVHGGNDPAGFFWAVLHEPKYFHLGHFIIYVHYPVLPWIGVMAAGYGIRKLFAPGVDRADRKKILLAYGFVAIGLFVILRSGNFYGDAAGWAVQQNFVFSLMSFFNVTKYPPSLLYLLMTIGPALIFLAIFEGTKHRIAEKIKIFGRVPMFYYMAHLLVIHFFAVIAAAVTGYGKYMIRLSNSVYYIPQLKGYGFSLATVYIIWIGLVILLFPVCRSFDIYKRAHQSAKRWLNYL